ncbi:MAG TPA: RidA family protein [Acidimicrobiales bacterium]|nr:RidA family protein [Acidimicrobiales bacterium]
MADTRRRSIDIEGAAHGAPIPMGCRIDNIVYSSGIMGTDPATEKVAESGPDQVKYAFANLRKFLDAAGVTPEDVIRMTVLLGDNSLRGAINEEWLKMFPDEASRPARHAMNLELAGTMLVQLEVICVAKD